MPAFQNWIFLAISSSVATTILIATSSATFGKTLPMIVVLGIRIFGVVVLGLPIVTYYIARESIWSQVLTSAKAVWPILFVIGVSGFISWYTFFAAIEASKLTGHSDAAVTAINYTSVALLVVVRYFMGKPVIWQNWVGVALVICGAYFATMSEDSSSGTAQTVPQKDAQSDVAPQR